MVKCRICNDTYKYIDKTTGIEVDCQCVLGNNSIGSGTIDNKHVAVKNEAIISGLIPKERIEDEFDIAFTKNRFRESLIRNRLKIHKIEDYTKVLNSIMGSLILGNKPTSSYLISAPNSFGKTTFVNTCIKICILNGWKVAPYISLMEMSELHDIHMHFINGVHIDSNITEDKYELYEEKVLNMFRSYNISFRDFINAEILFISLTSIQYAQYELPILGYILSERARRCRPTVVTSETSIKAYYDINDRTNMDNQKFDLKINEKYRYFWSEHLISDDFSSSYDRLKVVRCYVGSNKSVAGYESEY